MIQRVDPLLDQIVVARMDHYRSTLAPSQRDTDMGVIASVLTVAAYEDFDRALAP